MNFMLSFCLIGSKLKYICEIQLKIEKGNEKNNKYYN